MQLYVCNGTPQHFMEAVVYIVNTDLVGNHKKYINRYSVKGARAEAIGAMADFDE